MATYNIPGITTSVIDYSNTTTSLPGGRTPLIAGFSKFGSEELQIITNYDQLLYETGKPNLIKYGLAQDYIVGALTVTGSVLYKRLLPDDATYANINIDKDINSVSIAGAIDKKTIASNNILSQIATARGSGYNEFFIQYSISPDTEKIYADGEGDPKYRYNFLKCTIFQNTPNGIKTIASGFTVSLIDSDPKDNTPIFDITTGETLFINDRVPTKNNFIETLINDDYLPELKKYLSINGILNEKGTPEVILKDISTGTNYKLFVDRDNNFYLKSTTQSGQDKFILKYDNDGSTNYVKIFVENGKFVKESTTDVSSSDKTYETLYIPGDLYFASFYVNADTGNLDVKEFQTLRSNIYKKLLSKIWILENGFDGANIYKDGIFVFNGESTANAQNPKQLFLNFFGNDPEIKEVMYPKWNFNYIVDWTCDLDVMASIINLSDDIGNALGIISLPIAYNMKTDKEIRESKLYQSTYNTALYSGQWNLKHYNEFLGRIMAMPLSYYMMILHLKTDNNISITEPVAGLAKAQMPEANVKLSYDIDSYGIETLRNLQINTIIKETDGVYCIDQLTMYKKASKLSRINIVKVIHAMRRDLPKLLKKYIQLKETTNVTGSVRSDVQNYMNKWIVSGNGTNPDEIFKTVSINIIYIEEEYKLIVSIRVNPIGTIEKIDIPIIVE